MFNEIFIDEYEKVGGILAVDDLNGRWLCGEDCRTFIVLNDRISHDRAIIMNALYEHIPKVFFGTNSRVKRVSAIMIARS